MNWFKNLKIGRKLALGFGIILTLVSMVSGTAFVSIGSLIQTSGWVEHTHKVIRVGENLSASMVDMETGLRGFLVTGDETYLEPYHAGKKNFESLVKQGAKLTSDNPTQVKRWNHVAELKQEWLEKWAEPEIAKRKQVALGEQSIAHFKEISARTLGKTLFDGIRAKLAKLDSIIPEENLADKLLHTQTVLALVNMETGQRGFLLSGVEASLEPYIQGKKDLTSHLADLTNASVLYQEDVEIVKQAVDEWQQRVADVEIEARRDMNQYTVTLENIIADMAKGTGKQHMDGIRADISEIVVAEESLIVVRNQNQKDTAAFANNFTLFGTIIVVILSIFIAMIVTRSVVRPIGQMRDVVDDVVNSGDLSKTVSYQSKDEVGESIVAFNQLLNYMKQAIDEANIVVGDISAGKFDSRIQSEFAGDLLQLKKGVNNSADSIDNVMKELSRVMESMKNGDFNINIDANVEGEFLNIVNNATETTHSLNQSIGAIIDVMNSMQQGQFDQRVNVETQGDLQKLKDGINISMDALERAIKDVISIVVAQSEGDLTQQITNDYHGELDTLKQAVNDTTNRLQNVVSRAVNATEVVQSASTEVAQGALDLSQRVQQQAAALEQTTSTMEEMNSAVKNNTDNANQASNVALEVKEKSSKGTEVMQQTIQAMNEIQDSSQKISEIVTLIDSIAFQTNLLALNAAVEAARAGEHGRGFAVVAGEVRNLAQKSADAAKDISSLIHESVSRIDQGTKLASDSGEVLNEINESVDNVTTMVGQIAEASQQQLTGIEQVYKAISQMDNVTQQNAALVEETSAASESMSEQSSNLSEDMSFFNIGKQLKKVSTQAASTTTEPVETLKLEEKPKPATDEWQDF